MMKNTLLTSCCIFVFMTIINLSLKADNGNENFCFDADVPAAQDNLRAMCLTAPTLFCPATYLGCPSDNLDPSNTGFPTALPGDASCPDPIVSFTDEITTNTACLKIIHRTWEATYPPGSASIKLHSTCQQTLYLEDNSAPVINNCPSDVVIDLSTNCDSTAVWPVPTADDNCGIQFFMTTNYSGTTFPSGINTVTYTAQDFCGNVTTCSFNVSVIGSCCSNPTITCPSDVIRCPLTGNLTPSSTGVATASSSDISCPTPNITYIDTVTSTGPCNGAQEIDRLWTATDGTFTSSCTQHINVIDNTNPIISNTPSNLTVSGTGNNCQVAVTWNAPTASDGCDIASWSSNYDSGDLFSEGITTVIYTAVDNCGNSTTASFTVTIVCVCDSAPVITCPSNYFSCPTNPNTSPSVTGTATATVADANCGTPNVIYTDVILSSGPCSGATTIQRTWTATIANNNSLTADCLQTITISDNSVPNITNLPTNITVSGIGANCSVPATWNLPTATDDCGIASLTSNLSSGSSFNTGTTTVLYTATDNCGNTSVASFNVTVSCATCTTPPVLNCPADFNGCPTSGYPVPSYTGTATATISGANCNGTPLVTYTDVVNSNGSCANAYNITRTWKATDPNDTSLYTTCTQEIFLTDNGGPSITNIPADITVHGNGTNCSIPVKWASPQVNDDCGVANFNSTHDPGDIFTDGTTTVIYTATDNCGNTVVQTFTVTVDCLAGCTVPPSISCPSNYVTCPGGMLPSPSIAGVAVATPGSSICGTPFVFYSDFISMFGGCAGSYSANRTWTAFDPSNGLSSSCVQVIQLDDNTPPSIGNLPQNITVEGTGSGCLVNVSWATPTATDNCGIANLSSNFSIGTTFSQGTSTVIYTATDNCGNTSTASFTVTVNCAGCSTPPTISCPTDYTTCPNGSFPTPSVAGVAIGTAGSADCATPSVTYSDAMSSFGNCAGAITYQRTWTAYDLSNPSLNATCVQMISLEDNQNPVLSGLPQNIAVTAANGNCVAPVTWNPPTASDDCGINSLTSNFQSGHTFNEGTTTVTYTTVDNCGNSANGSFTVTVTCLACNTPPAISCPSNYTACSGSNFDPSVTGFANGTINGANCTGTPYVTYNDVITSTGPCAGAQEILRTWTATNTTNNLSSNCTQSVSLVDNSLPTIANVPSNISVTGAQNSCLVPVTWNNPTVTDACGTASLSSNYSSGTTFSEGTTTIIYTATDNCGNAVTASFTVTVTCEVCNTPPSITCPSDYTTCAMGSGIPNPTVTGFAYSVIDGPYCSGTPYMTYNDFISSTGPCTGAMQIERTWIATDPINKLQGTCVQHISLIDNSMPVITNLPNDLVLSGTGSNCVVPAIWNTPTASDDCGIASLSSNYSSGSSFSSGTTTVTYTAIDNCGNVTTASFNVTVQCAGCNTPPVIACPNNYTACITGPTGTALTGVATASNPNTNCTGTPTVTYSDVVTATGPCSGAQEIARTWTATDATTGLTSSCIQTISLADDTNPVIYNMPTNLTVTGTGSACSVAVTWNVPTATDDCGIVDLSCPYTNGATFNEGVTTVIYTATDNCGNTSIASFTITVICAGCSTPPVIFCPSNYTACITGPTDTALTGVASASNPNANCSGTPVITYADVITSTGPCAGAQEVARTWTATDPDTGLSSSCVQTISIEDVTNPVIYNMPTNLTITGTGSACSVAVTWNTPTATDDCGLVTLSCPYTNGDVFNEGVTTVTYTATDNCGNTSVASFTVTVICQVCNTAPAIACPADYTSCPTAGIPTPAISGQAIANATGTYCGTPTVSYTDIILNSGPCPDAKVIERTWTATDPINAALASSCTQVISLVDNTAPIMANCPIGLVIQGMTSMTGSGTGSGMGVGTICTGVAIFTPPTASDDCSTTTIVCTDQSGNVVTSGDTFEAGTTIVTCTATDLCGNASTCAFDILVTCNDDCDTMPILSCPANATVCIGADYSATALGSATAVGGTNCPNPVVSHTDALISSGPCTGEGVYNRTWTAAYPNITGSDVTCVQVITINNPVPTFTSCPENIIIGDDATPVLWTAPTLVDACATAVVTSTHNSGMTFSCGTTTVTYTATDACGHVVTCSFDVIVECISGGGFAYCPSDQVLSCGGNGGAVANWNMPIYNNTCSDCSTGQAIPGFVYMGTYGGSQYYCSISPATWPNAKNNCVASGGHLVDVNSAGENSFLANILTIQSAWIGLSDVNSEGNFEWCNGQPVTYTNWYAGQPNNYNNDQDYCEMLSTGEWNDQYSAYALEYIMEIPCNYITQLAGPTPGTLLTGGTYTVTYGVTDACNTNETCSFTITVEETLEMTCPADITVTAAPGAGTATATWDDPTATSCCSSCTGSLPGFVYMGSFQGHHYYCSQNPDTWSNAKAVCAANGGNLASINNAAENAYLANLLTLQSAWIGGNDLANEGNFTWCDGSAFGYTNWYPGQPNNYNGTQDCIEMLNNGQWNDQHENYQLEYILEIPDCIAITQATGPSAGSSFAVGTTTTITYSAVDGCGNSATCSFDVTIEVGGNNEPCGSGGSSSTFHYIDSCTFGGLTNVSGDDGGYGDYTNICEVIEPSIVVPIQLCPAFGGAKPHVMYWSCWIDFNQDGDFNDNYEFVAYGAGSQCLNGNVTIPSSVYNGYCTMRVSCKLGGYATDPCESYLYGETEDYCIEVINGSVRLDEEALDIRAATRDTAVELAEEQVESLANIEVKVYPNPVSNVMNVTISDIDQVEGMSLYSQEGRIITELEIKSETSLDVSDLSSGMYLMKVMQKDGKVTTEKVIIMH